MGNCCEASHHDAPERNDKAGVRGQGPPRPANLGQSANKNIARNMNQEQAQAHISVTGKEKIVNTNKDNSTVLQISPTPAQITNNISRGDEKDNNDLQNIDIKQEVDVNATEKVMTQDEADLKLDSESDSNSVELKKNEFIPMKSPSLSEQNKARKFEFLSIMREVVDYQPVYVDERRRTEIKSTSSNDKVIMEFSANQSSHNDQDSVIKSTKDVEKVTLTIDQKVDNIDKSTEHIEVNKPPELAQNNTENNPEYNNVSPKITHKMQDSKNQASEGITTDLTTINNNSSQKDKSVFYSTSISTTSNTMSILSSTDITEYASSEDGAFGNSATESSENLCSKQDLTTVPDEEHSLETSFVEGDILDHKLTPFEEVIDSKIEENFAVVEKSIHEKPIIDTDNIINGGTTPSVSQTEVEQLDENKKLGSAGVDTTTDIVEDSSITSQEVEENLSLQKELNDSKPTNDTENIIISTTLAASQTEQVHFNENKEQGSGVDVQNLPISSQEVEENLSLEEELNDSKPANDTENIIISTTLLAVSQTEQVHFNENKEQGSGVNVQNLPITSQEVEENLSLQKELNDSKPANDTENIIISTTLAVSQTEQVHFNENKEQGSSGVDVQNLSITNQETEENLAPLEKYYDCEPPSSTEDIVSSNLPSVARTEEHHVEESNIKDTVVGFQNVTNNDKSIKNQIEESATNINTEEIVNCASNLNQYISDIDKLESDDDNLIEDTETLVSPHGKETLVQHYSESETKISEQSTTASSSVESATIQEKIQSTNHSENNITKENSPTEINENLDSIISEIERIVEVSIKIVTEEFKETNNDTNNREELKTEEKGEGLDHSNPAEGENVASREIQDVPTPTLQNTDFVSTSLPAVDRSSDGEVVEEGLVTKRKTSDSIGKKSGKSSDLAPNFQLLDHPSKKVVADDPIVQPKSGISYAAALRGAKK